jgi:hypothetical protein
MSNFICVLIGPVACMFLLRDWEVCRSDYYLSALRVRHTASVPNVCVHTLGPSPGLPDSQGSQEVYA